MKNKIIFFVVFCVIIDLILLRYVLKSKWRKLPFSSKNLPFRAITLPPFIFYTKDVVVDKQLFEHEQTHFEQYRKLGFLRYYLFYLYYSFKYGYANNPMEIEAKNNAANV